MFQCHLNRNYKNHFEVKLIKMRSVVFWIVSTVSAGVCQREPCTKVIYQTLVQKRFCEMNRSIHESFPARQTDVGTVEPKLTAKVHSSAS